MPRYFFNARIGDDVIPDAEGKELRDPDHAWEVAKALILEILQDQPGLLAACLEVTDRAGEIVFEFPFSEALIGAQEVHQTRH
jgi:hypothetical protein